MVTGAYYPELSGAGLQCRTLVGALDDRVDCAVLTTATDPALPAHDDVDGIRVRRVAVDVTSRRSRAGAGARLVAAFLRLVRSRDIVHLHGFSRKSGPLILLARALGKRVAIKLTSVGHDDPVSMQARGRFAWRCYAAADLFIAVSPRLAQLYGQTGLPPERLRLIPNGVDVERFRPAEPGERKALREALGWPPDRPVVLFVGFFSHEKQPRVLFDAWARLREQGGRPANLVFVGATGSRYYEVDSALAGGVRAEARRRGLDTDIVFVERTAEIERYYRAADIFAMPSSREGLPNALLEAMASGLVCVVSVLPGVTDSLVRDGVDGLLVPVGDVGALTGALGAALDDPGLAVRLGGRARRRIEDGYTISATAGRHLDAYRALIEPGR
jgi:glycosyltransferase involved in cell wall biosynthesis